MRSWPQAKTEARAGQGRTATAAAKTNQFVPPTLQR